MTNDEKIILTPEQALSMLPEGDTIHTFRSSVPGVLVGADWDRDALEKVIREHQCEIGGKSCQSVNHGLVVWTSDTAALFVECRKGMDYETFETAEKGDSNE